MSLHAAVALFGFAALFGKWIALPATAIVLGRTSIAAVTLVIVCSWRAPAARPSRAPVVVNGAILALHWVTFFAAVQRRGRRGRPARLCELPAVRPDARAAAVHAGQRTRRSGDRRAGRGGPCRARSGFRVDERHVARPGARRPVGVHVCAAVGAQPDAGRARATDAHRVLAEPVCRRVPRTDRRGLDRMAAWPTAVGRRRCCSSSASPAPALAHTLFIASMQRVSAHTASVVAALSRSTALHWRLAAARSTSPATLPAGR